MDSLQSNAQCSLSEPTKPLILSIDILVLILLVYLVFSFYDFCPNILFADHLPFFLFLITSLDFGFVYQFSNKTNRKLHPAPTLLHDLKKISETNVIKKGLNNK